MLLKEEILRWSTPKLPRGRLDAVVTTLMLKAEGKEITLALKGIERGRYRIDEAFIELLFDEARTKLARLQLAESIAFGCLTPGTFKRLYFRLWRGRDSTARWRHGLAWSLQMFLRRHPDQGPRYAAMIEQQMRDRVEEIALLGLFTAGYLGSALSVSDVNHLCTHLDERSLKTMNALNALTGIYNRWAQAPRPARQLLSSRRVIKRIEQLGNEDDEDYKLLTSNCIRAMRKALVSSSKRDRRHSQSSTTCSHFS